MGSVSGGILIDVNDLYYGWFGFLEKNEPIRQDHFSPGGLWECFDLSYLDYDYSQI
jgi:hypothetical protein